MVIPIFSLVCFTLLYIFLVMSAKNRRKIQSQPATLAMISFSLLLLMGIVNFVGFTYFHAQMEQGNTQMGFIDVWVSIRGVLHLGVLAALVFCVFGWRKQAESNQGNSYAQPAKFLVFGLLLFLGVMFGSGIMTKIIMDRFYLSPKIMLGVWQVIMIGVEMASIMLLNTAIFSGREACIAQDVSETSSAVDVSGDSMNEEEGVGGTIDGRSQRLFAFKSTDKIRSPHICPHCSSQAKEEVMLKSYEYERPSFGLLIFAGLLGQLLAFLFVGFTGKELFKAKVCAACLGLSQLFRVLECFARLGSIVLVFFLITELSSKRNPLIQQDISTQLMVISPLLFGWIAGLIFHKLAVKYRGITFQRFSGCKKRIYQVKSLSWYDAFLELNPVTVKSSWK